ncbi:siphovirus Gp157 family protein [Sporanaerobacter acetigenes]|uniref:siphovirus Gp157 family protein n=1 Tax=Sporanaerobacter acetigenes TaxID=165813 RepID=UPI00331FEB87
MFKLYELAEMYRNIQDLINDDETDTETLENALSQVEGDINSKAENMAKLIRSIDGDIETLKAEEKRLANRRKTLENKQKNIKNYLEMQLKTMKIDKVKTPLFTVAIQNNAPSVKIIDENAIPEDFFKYTKSIVKKDILEALKNGEEVPRAELKQTKSLRIR